MYFVNTDSNYKNVFLGLDLGEKTLGIAISEFGIIAYNLKTIYFPKNQYTILIPHLKKIIAKFNVKTIILGLPKNMNNNLGIKAKISINFQKKIKKSCYNVKIILWDERLTTIQALEILHQNNYKKKNIKKYKDEIAAMIILQNFLNYQKDEKKSKI
ncbi:Hollyday junction resolvase [Candidatus Phytoplasma pini]|uniref:Putative pre-16S rRNA nuclease n=1 Tax=Candidatus Phytoplasma pini TaxID=267362 RepID=A0A559KJ92_9MOLU|nr:Hollyday junction resolvase [Candidatus Phytoplasma pini]